MKNPPQPFTLIKCVLDICEKNINGQQILVRNSLNEELHIQEIIRMDQIKDTSDYLLALDCIDNRDIYETFVYYEKYFPESIFILKTSNSENIIMNSGFFITISGYKKAYGFTQKSYKKSKKFWN